MRRLRSGTIAILTIVLITLILGCMEEATQEGDQSGGDVAGGDSTSGTVSSPVDVEVTNMKCEWHDYPDQPLTRPSLTVTCDAINYGGPGYVTVVMLANATNASVSMEQRIRLETNEQRTLTFYGKLPYKPMSINASTKREVVSITAPPTSGGPEVEIANLWHEALWWIDPDKTQLQIAVHASPINYGQPGYVTVSVEIACRGVTNKVEQRVHLAWNEQVDLRLEAVVPYESFNLTAYVRRPQPD